MAKKNKKNRLEVRSRPCLLCGRVGSDPHHYPVRRSHGAGDGLDEMVPLCRIHHDMVHSGNSDIMMVFEASADAYLRMVHVCDTLLPDAGRGRGSIPRPDRQGIGVGDSKAGTVSPVEGGDSSTAGEHGG